MSDLNKLKNQDDAVKKATKPHLSLPQAEANMLPHELAPGSWARPNQCQLALTCGQPVAR